MFETVSSENFFLFLWQLLCSLAAKQSEWSASTFVGSYSDAKTQSAVFQEYKLTTKRTWVTERQDLVTLFGNVQTKLKTYNLREWVPQAGLGINVSLSHSFIPGPVDSFARIWIVHGMSWSLQKLDNLDLLMHKFESKVHSILSFSSSFRKVSRNLYGRSSRRLQIHLKSDYVLSRRKFHLWMVLLRFGIRIADAFHALMAI